MKTNYHLTLDLHGRRREEALRLVGSQLYSARNRGRSLLGVHGCGNGVLRQAVRELAAGCPLVREIWFGEEYNLPGGSGVTAIFL